MDLYETDFLKDLDLLDFTQTEQIFGNAATQQDFHQRQSQPMFMPNSFPPLHSVQSFRRNYQKEEFLPNFPLDFDETFFQPTEIQPATYERSTEPSKDLEFEGLNHGKRCREMKLEEPSHSKKRKLSQSAVLGSTVGAPMKYKAKQKRTKWLRKEVQSLWEGIAMFGNNWRLIKKKAFGHRTYYQVKDKGRRILSSQGWSSGRTKATHDGAAEEAKLIAEKVLLSSGARKAEDNTSDVVSNVGSTGSPTPSDNEFDFDLELCN